MTTDETQAHSLGSVLIVEDEVLIRLDLAVQLRAVGLSALEAANVNEAVTILKTIRTVALVVSDIRMPGGADGLDLVGWLRRERPAIKIMLVSGHVPSASLSTIADVALAKPVSRSLFVAEARRLLVEAASAD
jgi:CheY-like chemotaxis protein